jgi:cyclopropane fatty-acyl-phospholipid synthase-like methyltransferase
MTFYLLVMHLPSYDFYRFLGPRMIYTSGVVLNPDIEESLEQLQDNKLAVVCSKLNLKPTDKYVPICASFDGTLT